MKIIWSIPTRGESLDSGRGDLVRARRLIEALRADGHEVIVFEDAARRSARLSVSTYRNLVSWLLPRRLALIVRDFGRWLHSWGHGLHVAAAARKQGADLLIETQVGFATSGALAARRTGLPLLLDDCSPSSEESVLGAGLPSLARYTFQSQTRAATAVVAVSEAMRDALLAEGVRPEKIYLVQNGVDADAYRHLDRARVRQQLGIADRYVVGFVGSFQPWHRIDVLIEAAARFRDTERLHLLLVGDGLERSRAIALAQTNGMAEQITAPGEVPPDRVPELISAFDIGVLPGSNHYGHPMKLLEYAAAGVASVAPDIPTVREVIEHEVTGLLFSPCDPSALAAALSRLARDDGLRQRLARAARRKVEKGTSWRERGRTLVSGYSERAEMLVRGGSE